MKPMKAKTKTKKSNEKFGRVKFPSKEVTAINPDLSQLRPPIDTSVSTLYRVSKVLENGSDEVRSILAYECDLVYECRICRSLFRSVANFISHKRIYCKERYDVTFTKISSNDYDTSAINKLGTVKPETIYQESCGNDRILRSQVSKEEQKKDLTAVVNMLQKKQIENLQINRERLYLESMHSNSSAVYQTVETMVSTSSCTELMKEQVTELKNINEKSAVLGPNGQLVQSSQELGNANRSQACCNEENDIVHENNVTCSICHAKFSTKKTLAVHTRTLHTSHRLCYPCPCCSSTFANTWSVYRHLFKVHRKTNDQVRKLRPQIQEKAFIKGTTVAEDMQKEDAHKTLMSKALRVNETQEWIDHLESDTELQRCGGCGKRFDRKAALSSHSQYCHRRVAAYESTTKVKKMTKVPTDYTFDQNVINDSEVEKRNVVVQDSAISTEINNSNETSIRVEAVSTLSKADWDKLDSGESVSQIESNGTTASTNAIQGTAEKDNRTSPNDISDPLEIVYTSINKCKTSIGSRKRKNKDSIKKLTNGTENIVKVTPVKVSTKQGMEIPKIDHALLMEKKVASIVNLQKLQCLPCKRNFTSVNNLRRHAAIHIGWNRYQCKLCDYKCFVKCDCVAHCNKVHNAQNNRVIIEEMITQIPDDQYMCDENIMLNITNLEEQIGTPRVVEVDIPPDQIGSVVETKEKNTDKTEMEVVDARPTVLNQEMPHVNGETQETTNSDSKGQNTLGLDPDLRRMVMEVIFGSSDVNSPKQVQTGEIVNPEKSNSKLGSEENFDMQPKDSDSRGCDISTVHDNSKPQRPIRNKMKRLNKDFIYDLKEVTFRKESLVMKPFNKTFVKKPFIQQEDNLDKDTEQPPKRLKPLQDEEISIVCESSVLDKCNTKLEGDLKSSLSYSQCHS